MREQKKRKPDILLEQIGAEDFCKCGNIWDMKACPFTEHFYAQLKHGSRLTFVYQVHGAYIAEGSLVTEHDDREYVIPNERIYLSRMIVKKGYRNQGIGGMLLDFLIQKAKELGYKEMALGVDCDNACALHLYRKKGFDTIIRRDEDEYGAYYKLLKIL